MKKGIRILMIIIMLLGISFSISNFISVELKAGTLKGAWIEEPDGSYKCRGDGSECSIVFWQWAP